MRRFLFLAMFAMAAAAVRGAEPVEVIGKQRAAVSPVEWDVRDVEHPLLGAIRVAVQKSAMVTSARGGKFVSSAYVSCQKASGKIAVELASAPEANPATGLGPIDLPRLVCTSLRPQGDLVKSDVAASWEISGLGDTLARGLSPATLRQCVSIEVVQNLALPQGWPQANARVSMDVMPYGREMDSVFAACGERTAYAPPPAPAARTALAPAAKPALTPAPPAARVEAAPHAEEAPWRAARATTKGRTNVRSAASLESGLVTHLDPGARVLVQPASGDWWKVRPRKGSDFAGYIRRDRFTFE